jgi:hypothetical protein
MNRSIAQVPPIRERTESRREHTFPSFELK